MELRIKPEQCIEMAQSSGFANPEKYDLFPYHYGLTLKKIISNPFNLR